MELLCETRLRQVNVFEKELFYFKIDHQSINQSINWYRDDISSVARTSGRTGESEFNSKVNEAVTSNAQMVCMGERPRQSPLCRLYC